MQIVYDRNTYFLIDTKRGIKLCTGNLKKVEALYKKITNKPITQITYI